jgi:hypothetical protein
LTENSVSLTGCNRLTCKGDGKLSQHVDQVNPTSSDEDDAIFRNQRNFPTVNLTNSDDSDGTFRNQRNFPAVFCSMRRNFPTIFRQLSDSNLKSKAAVAGLDPPSFRITTCYSTTAPHSLSVVMSLSAISYPSPVYVLSYFISTVLIVFTFVSAVFSFVSALFTFVNTVIFFVSTVFFFVSRYSVNLCQYCIFLRQYCVTLRQYCVLLRQYSVHLRQ